MKENIAIAPTDQRQSERHTSLQSRQGKLSLTVEGRPDTLGVLSLLDISPFGVGLESSQLIEEGARVQLMYEEANLVLAVIGTIVWHNRPTLTGVDTAHQENYRLGVTFHPANIENNINFFRYMSGIQ